MHWDKGESGRQKEMQGALQNMLSLYICVLTTFVPKSSTPCSLPFTRLPLQSYTNNIELTHQFEDPMLMLRIPVQPPPLVSSQPPSSHARPPVPPHGPTFTRVSVKAIDLLMRCPKYVLCYFLVGIACRVVHIYCRGGTKNAQIS